MQEDLRAELERVDANTHQAPVDIVMADTVPLAVPDLAYQNYGNTPTKMKLNNTGFTGRKRAVHTDAPRRGSLTGTTALTALLQ